MKRFLIIYNCSADSRPAPEVIAIDSVRHVWLALPHETQICIEYYRQSTDSLCSVREFYRDRISANERMARIMDTLGCHEQKQINNTGILLDWQYEANNE